MGLEAISSAVGQRTIIPSGRCNTAGSASGLQHQQAAFHIHVLQTQHQLLQHHLDTTRGVRGNKFYKRAKLSRHDYGRFQTWQLAEAQQPRNFNFKLSHPKNSYVLIALKTGNNIN